MINGINTFWSLIDKHDKLGIIKSTTELEEYERTKHLFGIQEIL